MRKGWCPYWALCRRRSSCVYKHSKYKDFKPEEEIYRFKKELHELEKSNAEKIKFLAVAYQRELKEIKNYTITVEQEHGIILIVIIVRKALKK